MATKPVHRAVAAPSQAGRLEALLAKQGYRFVAGVDEVGRGALAGPLVAAAVLVDVDRLPEGVNDSKLLTPEARQQLAVGVHAAAIAVSYAVVDSADIDADGLHISNLAALLRAVRQLRPTPDYVISDYFALPACGLPHVGLPKADTMSAAVASASIIAKVSRDAFMVRLDAAYPGYGFSHNMGYGTSEHWAALRGLGPSPVHRRSFRGVGSWQPSLLD